MAIPLHVLIEGMELHYVVQPDSFGGANCGLYLESNDLVLFNPVSFHHFIKLHF